MPERSAEPRAGPPRDPAPPGGRRSEPEARPPAPGEPVGSPVAPGTAPLLHRAEHPGAIKSRLPEPETLARELIREPVSGPVRIIFLDGDGTLSDGIVGYTGEGVDYRNFWVRDGIALQWARDLSVLPVVISGRRSKAMAARMEDLGLEYHEGMRDKVAVAERVLARVGARWDQCVMVGDDLPDVALMKRVGWPIAVANAQPEVQLVAKTLLGTQGGRGAVREMVEMVLRHNGTWEKVLDRYGAR